MLFTSFCFVTLADKSDVKKALSLSGASLKGSTLTIEVSKKVAKGGKPESFSSPGAFASPRGGGYQSGNNRGEFECSDWLKSML